MFLFYQQKINKKKYKISNFLGIPINPNTVHIYVCIVIVLKDICDEKDGPQRERERESHGHIMCFSILQLAFIP